MKEGYVLEKERGMRRVVLPELGVGIDKATVACWHCNIGDYVRKDDDLLEVVTDKATFNVAAPSEGIVKEILVPEGQEVKVGEVLAVLGTLDVQ